MELLSSVWEWLKGPALELSGVVTSRLEVIAFIFGAWCVWLVARQRALNWPIGIVNSIAFLFLFATAGLFADAALQGVYIALGLYGWWAWVYGGPQHDDLPVTNTTNRQWIVLGVVGALATVGMWWVLSTHTSSTVPWPDSVTTVLSLAATWGQCRKKVESWWLWIAADVIYIPLYAYKGLWLTAVLYVVFQSLCIMGLRSWQRDVAARFDQAPDLTDPSLGVGTAVA